MEQDLRELAALLLQEQPLGKLLDEDRRDRAQARRIRDGMRPGAEISSLLPYLDFGDSYELLAGQRSSLTPTVKEAIQYLGPHVASIIAIRNRVAHTRPMEIDDAATLIDCAEYLDRHASPWPTTTDTLARLRADPAYVLGLTINLPTDPDRAPQHNLPIPDFDETGFFGRQQELSRIKRAIRGAYPVVSILGDGGIGKTSIALKVVYDLLDDPKQLFDAFVWVTAKATILTPTEIRRIHGAIETSLGLFATAAEELGGQTIGDPIEEVLEYMENFRVLLILDNLETVLDQRLRDFLLDLPLGSKVIVTSRIGLGIENPVQLQPLSLDDSTRLLRALARVRSVPALTALDQRSVESLTERMAGHPAYIRWFVAGVQAGQRPEELISENDLLLDYCMSNVYGYLTEDARAAVRSMQTLPGDHSQAELAFLNDFDAARVQRALLELLTTNFVQMSSKIDGQAFDTTYSLSEFALQYLEKHHPVAQNERNWLLSRAGDLRELGFELSVESSSSPFASETVLIRGTGDVHAARLLRDAILQAETDPSSALALCKEAQMLAPSYYESWRVEATVHARDNNNGAAVASFERASELAPDSPILAFHYGYYLLNDAGDPTRGLAVLQRGARSDGESTELLGQIAWAHYCLGDLQSCVATSNHVLMSRRSARRDKRAAAILALRALNQVFGEVTSNADFGDQAGLLEATLDRLERLHVNQLRGEPLDRILFLVSQFERFVGRSERVGQRALALVERMTALRSAVDSAAMDRSIGSIKTLVREKRFGFIRVVAPVYFFHFQDLVESHHWESLEEGSICALTPVVPSPKGPKAREVRLLQ